MSENYSEDMVFQLLGKTVFLCLFTVNWLVEPLIIVVNGNNENIRSPVRDDMFVGEQPPKDPKVP